MEPPNPFQFRVRYHFPLSPQLLLESRPREERGGRPKEPGLDSNPVLHPQDTLDLFRFFTHKV